MNVDRPATVTPAPDPAQDLPVAMSDPADDVDALLAAVERLQRAAPAAMDVRLGALDEAERELVAAAELWAEARAAAAGYRDRLAAALAADAVTLRDVPDRPGQRVLSLLLGSVAEAGQSDGELPSDAMPEVALSVGEQMYAFLKASPGRWWRSSAVSQAVGRPRGKPGITLRPWIDAGRIERRKISDGNKGSEYRVPAAASSSEA